LKDISWVLLYDGRQAAGGEVPPPGALPPPFSAPAGEVLPSPPPNVRTCHTSAVPSGAALLLALLVPQLLPGTCLPCITRLGKRPCMWRGRCSLPVLQVGAMSDVVQQGALPHYSVCIFCASSAPACCFPGIISLASVVGKRPRAQPTVRQHSEQAPLPAAPRGWDDGSKRRHAERAGHTLGIHTMQWKTAA